MVYLRSASRYTVDTVQDADPMGPRLCQLQKVPMTRNLSLCLCPQILDMSIIF